MEQSDPNPGSRHGFRNVDKEAEMEGEEERQTRQSDRERGKCRVWRPGWRSGVWLPSQWPSRLPGRPRPPVPSPHSPRRSFCRGAGCPAPNSLHTGPTVPPSPVTLSGSGVGEGGSQQPQGLELDSEEELEEGKVPDKAPVEVKCGQERLGGDWRRQGGGGAEGAAGAAGWQVPRAKVVPGGCLGRCWGSRWGRAGGQRPCARALGGQWAGWG